LIFFIKSISNNSDYYSRKDYKQRCIFLFMGEFDKEPVRFMLGWKGSLDELMLIEERIFE